MTTILLNKIQSYNTRVVLIVTVAAIGGLLFGFDTSIIAGAAPFIKQEFHTANWQLECIVSSCIFGAFIGCMCSGYLTDRYGRKKIMLFTALIFIFGTLLASQASSIPTLTLGRFIIGIGIGIASFIAPMFIAEIAPPDKRGGLVLWNQCFITAGQVTAFLASYYFTANQDWRSMILSGLIPALLLLLGITTIPASPKWLASKQRVDEALSILEKIRKNSQQAKLELSLLKKEQNVQIESLKKIWNGPIKPVLIIGLFLGICQQFCGINTVMYYGPSIMSKIGFKGSQAQILGILGLGLVNFTFTVITILYIDKIGRRKFLMTGTLLMFVSLCTLIALFNAVSNLWSGYMMLGALFFYIMGFCFSMALFWLLIAELFPVHIRATCMSFVAGIQWLANFIVALTFLSVLDVLGFSWTFFMYASISLIAFAFIYRFVPETKGVTLEQIENNLKQGVSTRHLGL